MIREDSLNEKDKQIESCKEWGRRKSLIEFIMLENRCSCSEAIVIERDSRERRKNELTK